jgi:hypothetical protein
MASINLKREKRVMDVLDNTITPMKEFNHSNTEPIWRQNGYQLKFNENNSDYLAFNSTQTISNVGDYLEFKFKLETLTLASNETFVSDGDVGNYVTIKTDLFIYVEPVGPIPLQVSQLENTIRLEVVVGGIDITLNGVTHNSTVVSAFSFSQFFKRATTNATGTLEYIETQNERFLLEDSIGNTTVGDGGTILDIYTSHANGQQYIDAEMWEKKSFALSLSNSNNESIVLDNSVVLSGDFELMFKITSDVSSNTQSLASLGSSPKLSLFGNGKIYFQTDTDALYLSATFKLPLLGSFVYEIKRVGNDTMFYVDGGLVDTISGYNGNITIQQLFISGSFSFDGTVKSFSIDDEQFNLTEGLGNEITGSNGAGATIYTSHANGIERINYGMWQKNSYQISLNGDNQDYLDLPNSTLNTDIPPTGDFEYGVTMIVPLTPIINSAKGLVGRNRLGTATDRYGLVLPANDDLRIINGADNYNLSNFTATYGGQTVKLIVKYEASDLVLFIDDIEVLREVGITRPTTGLFRFYIGAYGFGDSSDTPSANRYFSGIIESAFWGDETWNFYEGVGNFTASNLNGYEMDLIMVSNILIRICGITV